MKTITHLKEKTVLLDAELDMMDKLKAGSIDRKTYNSWLKGLNQTIEEQAVVEIDVFEDSLEDGKLTYSQYVDKKKTINFRLKYQKKFHKMFRDRYLNGETNKESFSENYLMHFYMKRDAIKEMIEYCKNK